MTITIIDYGVGNLRSVQKAIESLGVDVRISSDAAVIRGSDILILPGQGAFEQAMTELRRIGIVDDLKAHIQSGKSYLGICLGFQILFDSSEEDGGHEGLGVFPGRVEKFVSHDEHPIKIPHMGWNELQVDGDPSAVYSGLTTPIHTYFVHSYYVRDTDAAIVSTRTPYGGHSFVSSIQTPSVLATQFHPEKSSGVGLSILKQWLQSQMG